MYPRPSSFQGLARHVLRQGGGDPQGMPLPARALVLRQPLHDSQSFISWDSAAEASWCFAPIPVSSAKAKVKEARARMAIVFRVSFMGSPVLGPTILAACIRDDSGIVLFHPWLSLLTIRDPRISLPAYRPHSA